VDLPILQRKRRVVVRRLHRRRRGEGRGGSFLGPSPAGSSDLEADTAPLSSPTPPSGSGGGASTEIALKEVLRAKGSVADRRIVASSPPARVTANAALLVRPDSHAVRLVIDLTPCFFVREFDGKVRSTEAVEVPPLMA
jgi:hypothetical protein